MQLTDKPNSPENDTNRSNSSTNLVEEHDYFYKNDVFNISPENSSSTNSSKPKLSLKLNLSVLNKGDEGVASRKEKSIESREIMI